MIYHDIDQNSDEWLDLRAGKLTGSAMGKVMANYGKAFGEPAKQYAAIIACEQVTGRRVASSSFSNAHTERGHEQEPIARAHYEDLYFVDVNNGGFFESGNLGTSPDGLIGDSGLVEIKSVIAPVHYSNIKRNGIDPSYKWQIFFNLKLTEREWIDSISYCADFPVDNNLFVHRVYASDCEEQFEMLDSRISQFIKLVDDIKLIITGHSS